MATKRGKSKSKTIGWGLIGSGGFAEHTFAPALKEARGAELRAVLAPNRSEADAFCRRHKIDSGYDDLAEFVADKSFQAVWIAGPNHMHRDFAVAALKAGKHVLCEKPMAVTSAECRAMIRAAKQARRKLHIAYNTRHHPKIQAVQKEWAAGRFGKPVHGRALLYYPYPEDIGHRGRGKLGGWHSFDKQVGGWAYGDCGTHLIDQLRWFLGDAKKVLASHNSNPSWGYQTPDHAVAMIAFKNGAVGTISASTGLISHNPRLEFYGDKGYIVIDGGLLGEPGSLTTGIEDVGKTNRGHGVTRRVKKRTIQLPVTKTYKYQVEAFGRTITSRAAFPLEPEDGLANIELISQARGW